MNIMDAIGYARRGYAILFVGSGFSLGAENIASRPLRTAKQLAEDLCDLTGENNLDLMEAAEEYEDQKSNSDLYSFLQREFTVKSTTEAQRTICSLPWSRIYTTNYDNVIEHCFEEAGKAISSKNVSDSVIYCDDLVCIHLNGFIKDISSSRDISSQIRLSERSYLVSNIAQYDWFAQLRKDVKYAKSVFFVGYSLPLYDIEIAHLLIADEELRNKCFFVTKTVLSNRERRKLSNFGTIMNIEAEGFSKMIKEHQEKYEFKEDHEIGMALQKFALPHQTSRINGKDIEYLLLFSKVSLDKILHPQYMISTGYERKIYDELDKNIDVILVHSNIADGKTFLMKKIAAELSQRNVDVYFLTECNEYLSQELSTIGSINKKSIIIIDDFNLFDETIDFIKTKHNNVSFILTMRTAIYDYSRSEIMHKFEGLSFSPVNCSYLDDNSLNELIRRLDAMAAWRKMQGSSKDNKMRFLKGKKGNSEFSAILLSLFNDPEIGKKIQAPYCRLCNDKNMQRVLISAFVIAIVGVKRSYEIIVGLFGCRCFNNAHNELNNYIDIVNGEISVRSYSVAVFLLRQERYTIVIDVMKSLVDYTKNISRYRKVYEKIMTFGKIQNFFKENSRFIAITEFYQSLQASCCHDPLFWLQFAICKHVENDLKTAEKYFDAARSLALNNSSFRSFQLDNAYASFLVDRALLLPPNEAFSDFQKAHSNVLKELNSDDNNYRYYPYRTARHYAKFIQKHFCGFTTEQQKYILSSCEFVLSKISLLSNESILNNQDVLECQRSLCREYLRITKTPPNR